MGVYIVYIFFNFEKESIFFYILVLYLLSFCYEFSVELRIGNILSNDIQVI